MNNILNILNYDKLYFDFDTFKMFNKNVKIIRTSDVNSKRYIISIFLFQKIFKNFDSVYYKTFNCKSLEQINEVDLMTHCLKCDNNNKITNKNDLIMTHYSVNNENFHIINKYLNYVSPDDFLQIGLDLKNKQMSNINKADFIIRDFFCSNSMIDLTKDIDIIFLKFCNEEFLNLNEMKIIQFIKNNGIGNNIITNIESFKKKYLYKLQ
jgi:hypothetical protein